MTRATVLQEVRPIRVEERYARRQRRTLTRAEATEMLGVTERTLRRWSGRYDIEGAEGVQDRRLSRAAARAVPVDEALRRGNAGGDPGHGLDLLCRHPFVATATASATGLLPGAESR